MIIEINDRVGTTWCTTLGRSWIRITLLPVSARKRIACNLSHTTTMSAYRPRSLHLHVTLPGLTYVRARSCTILQLATVYSYILFAHRVDRSFPTSTNDRALRRLQFADCQIIAPFSLRPVAEGIKKKEREKSDICSELPRPRSSRVLRGWKNSRSDGEETRGTECR